MSEAKYTKEHEWIVLEGGIATVGITDFAQEQLGDIVFIELPESGQEIRQGDEVAVIESVKAAGEIHAPFNGTVIEVNETLAEEPETVNEDATGAGWFFKAEVGEADLSGFLTKDEYQTFVDEEC